MGILHKYPGVVGAVFAGHDHDGGYNVDAMDIHHIVRPVIYSVWLYSTLSLRLTSSFLLWPHPFSPSQLTPSSSTSLILTLSPHTPSIICINNMFSHHKFFSTTTLSCPPIGPPLSLGMWRRTSSLWTCDCASRYPMNITPLPAPPGLNHYIHPPQLYSPSAT